MMKNKVVLLPFPFDDLSTTKVRPAVCLTERVGIHRNIVFAFITNQTAPDLIETDLILDSSQADFKLTGLRVTSTLRLHRLLTASSSLILRELGELSPRMQSESADKIRKLFNL